MKLPKISPNSLFRFKKSRSVSLSNPPSFGSATSSSSADSLSSSANVKDGIATTPKSVLRSKSVEISNNSSDLSPDIHFELVQEFKLIDKDGDGKITRHELETLLSRVVADPPNEEELTMMLSEVDRNGDGFISLEEFGAITSAFGPAHGSDLRDAFEFFDADKDGKISAEELFGVFKTIGDKRCTLADCRRMISGVDTDGDGFVCFEDFSRMMERQRC